MSVVDLLHDVAVDEHRERRKLLLDYQSAVTDVQTCRYHIDQWEQRQLRAQRRLKQAVKDLEDRGWSIP